MKSSAVDTTLSSTSTALRILKDFAEALTSAPYVKVVAGLSIQILEIREQIISNKELCYRLIDNVATRSTALIEALEQVKKSGNTELKDLEKDLEHYKKLLLDIHRGLLGLTAAGRAKAVIKLQAIVKRDEVKKNLQDYSNKLTEFDSVFIFTRLVNIEAKFDKIHAPAQPVVPSPVLPGLGSPCSRPPSNFFTGRKDILAQMAKYFSESSSTTSRQRIFALYGMGGAGKTQIVLKFIEQRKGPWWGIHFIDASSTETLAAAFKNIGSRAGYTEPSLADTLQWFTSQTKWLLFFDNADDPSVDLHQFIPACSHGNIIITSRNPQMRRYAPHGHYHVGGLDEADAVSLLLRSSMLSQEDGSEQCAKELVQELGLLALAIAQAGAFISSSPGMSFEAYLRLYKANKDELLREAMGQDVDGYRWTVYTTWEMSFRKLDSLAAQVLQLSSYWHYDKIPKAIFRHALLATQGDVPDGWDDAASFLVNFQDSTGQWSELTFQRVINQLNSFSLITLYWEDSYSIHPLVHSWARDRGTTAKDSHSSLAAHLLGLFLQGRERRYRTVAGPHVRAWVGLQKDPYSSLDSDGLLAFQFGQVCIHMACWTEAEQLLSFALDRTEDRFSVMTQLAILYSHRGRQADAEKLMLSVVEEAGGEENPDTPLYVANLAIIYAEQGRLDLAEDLEKMVLEKRSESLGEDHPDTLTAMVHLGCTYSAQRRFDDAVQLQVSALGQLKKTRGEEHPDTFHCMHHLANTYAKNMELAKAEELQVVALEGTKKTLGDDHPDTIIMMDWLCQLYVLQDRSAEVESLLETLVSKRKAILGEAHRDTQASLRYLQIMKEGRESGEWYRCSRLRKLMCRDMW